VFVCVYVFYAIYCDVSAWPICPFAFNKLID